jgi:hypothetical protein
MTNEWWKEEPFCKLDDPANYFVDIEVYNVPLIIEEAKRRERGETKIVQMKDGSEKRMCGACEKEIPLSVLMVLPPRFCPCCGLKINWK